MPKRQGPPPWHMWGNSIVFDCRSVGGASVTVQNQQLVRINYGRPDTWRWFFDAEVIEANAPNYISLAVEFFVTMGVGRTNTEVQLCRFAWQNPPTVILPVAPTIAADKFTNNISGPLHADSQTTVPNVINTFVAQDIQVRAQVVFADATAGEFAKVNVTAMFAPQTHVRPEWMRGEFGGAEDKTGF